MGFHVIRTMTSDIGVTFGARHRRLVEARHVQEEEDEQEGHTRDDGDDSDKDVGIAGHVAIETRMLSSYRTAK